MTGKNQIRIKLVIADDHEIIRLGLRDLLESDKFFNLIEEADNGEDAVELAEYFNPDMVLLDLDMPRMDGCEAGKLIKKFNPNIKVVFYVAEDGTENHRNLEGFDSDGLLSKDLTRDDLVSALHRIAEGEKVNSTHCTKCGKTIYISENVA